MGGRVQGGVEREGPKGSKRGTWRAMLSASAAALGGTYGRE